MHRSPITTHILDTALGCPAAGVALQLDKVDASGQWVTLASGTTNSDGRVADLLPSDHVLQPGCYRMRFQTGGYFARNKSAGFYPYADVVFEITDTKSHYHIPLLLSPFGYSTYRGS